MSTNKINEMPESEIKEAVRDKYSRVAVDPCGKFNFPVGRKFALSVRYPDDAHSELPEFVYESFTGAGNPQPFVDPPAGATLLDIGCGAGVDLIFYARKIGGGKVMGLDFSKEMLNKAEDNLAAAGVKNYEFLCASASDIPLEHGTVDMVTSNGIYNLSPDKAAVVAEVFRVLKHGGRTVFSEVVLKGPLPENTLDNIDDWFRCIGGAMVENDLIAMFESAGFTDVAILDRTRNARCGHELAICATITAMKPA